MSTTYFEPLNLFLYSWRFLRELEHSTTSPALKKVYKWFERISIVIIPLAFFIIVIWYESANAWLVVYTARLQLKKANQYETLVNKLVTARSYLLPFTNLFSCVILGLVLRLVLKLSKQVRVGKRAVAEKR